MRTILLVEDNDDNRTIYSTVFERAGYAVLTAETGELGLTLARSARPDAILMDGSLPGIDGWEVTKRLKADPETSSIPIIILTAHVLASDRERAVSVGADGYITKPAELKKVVSEVDRLVAAARSAPPTR